MEVDIKLNVGTFVLLGVIGLLGYELYKKTNKVTLLNKELESVKEAKGEPIM